MRASLLCAVLAGVAWGVGGYFEKGGLRALGMPPLVGIACRTLVAAVLLGAIAAPVWRSTRLQLSPAGWLMLVAGGGIVAGTLGMWAFYAALAASTNLGVTLALAFACAPVAGTAVGIVRGDQPLNVRLILGLVAIVAGIALVQLGRDPVPHP